MNINYNIGLSNSHSYFLYLSYFNNTRLCSIETKYESLCYCVIVLL